MGIDANVIVKAGYGDPQLETRVSSKIAKVKRGRPLSRSSSSLTNQTSDAAGSDRNRLLAHKKLVLLVDLDQTLVHTTCEPVDARIEGVHHHRATDHGKTWYHTRIRPGTEEFLRKVSRIFELHVFTLGGRGYANRIVELIDPEKKYFRNRILSRDDCADKQSKAANLNLLFPHGDDMVVMIDDREDVWDNAPSLVAVKPYVFFKGTGDDNAPPGLPTVHHTSPEFEGRARGPIVEDDDDHLFYLEETLGAIHREFFKRYEGMQTNEPGNAATVTIPDLKQLIPEMRRRVLDGIVIVFSGCVPVDEELESADIHRVAVSLGAKVRNTLCKEVTHLVAARFGTAKTRQVRRLPEIKVVSPEWLMACAERWERIAEILFPLSDSAPEAAAKRRVSDAEDDRRSFHPAAKKLRSDGVLGNLRAMNN